MIYTFRGFTYVVNKKYALSRRITVEKKIYGKPEIKISSILCDIITQSQIEDYTEPEEWNGPSLPMADN